METATLLPLLAFMDTTDKPTDPFRSAIHPRISENLRAQRRSLQRGPGYSIDPAEFRNTLGHVPTSVVVVASMEGEDPIGLAIGSFVSISLDPPLVGFFAQKHSLTVPKVLKNGTFCVNVLGTNRVELGKRFSQPVEDRFAGLDWRPGVTGCPALTDAIAWIECHVFEEIPIGDHVLVVGGVERLGVNEEIVNPQGLAFFRGEFSGLNIAE